MKQLKILIPTDFSVQAEFAYLMVQQLSQKVTADIHFLHVLNVPDSVSLDSTGLIITDGEIDATFITKQKEIAERKLAELNDVYHGNFETHLILGKLTDAISAFAEQHHFDLVVMGTKGAHGLREKLSGSESQMVARHCKIPVLTMHCNQSRLPLQHLLFVHDFEQPIGQDLTLVRMFAHEFGVKIHLLQISSSNVTEGKEMIESQMQNMARDQQFTHYDMHIIAAQDVEQGVVQFNEQSEIDLVVIGTFGKGGLLHNSVTERLINHLQKPVLSFHLS